MCIRDRLYNELVKKEKMSKEEKSQKKKLAKQLVACRTEQGLSKASLEHYLKAVSYTHLDVYKRQVVGHAASNDRTHHDKNNADGL